MGSRVMRAAPAAIWVPGGAPTVRTRPGKAAATTVSIFIVSRTASGSPAATSSPGATATEITTPGDGARTTPPSSRVSVWVIPSTSTVWSGPSATDVTLNDRPPMTTLRS